MQKIAIYKVIIYEVNTAQLVPWATQRIPKETNVSLVEILSKNKKRNKMDFKDFDWHWRRLHSVTAETKSSLHYLDERRRCAHPKTSVVRI